MTLNWIDPVEAEVLGERGFRRIEVVYRDDHVIDASGHSVECRASALGGGCFVGRGIGASASNLNAMGLAEQHAKDLLGKIGVDANIDCPLPTTGEHIAYASWLNYRSVGALFYFGDFATDIDTRSKYLHKLTIERVDFSAEFGKASHRIDRSDWVSQSTCCATL